MINLRSLFQYYQYFLFYTYVYYFKVLYLLGLHDPKAYQPKHKIKTIKETESEYCNRKLERFRKFGGDDDSSFPKEDQSKNQNVDRIFYDKKMYDVYMQTPNTDLEKKWKSNILLETTPRGNIIMYYDAYKMGFAYFSDQKGISYDILNACAMKYVEIFRCCDFFVDETVIQTSKFPYLSTILQHYTPLKLTHFLSTNLKNKNETIRNKFLYIGKISSGNCLLLQTYKEPVKNSLPIFQSTLLENMKKDGKDNKRLTYKDFKYMNPLY